MLAGQDDWSSLVYDFRQTPDFADGSHSSAAQVVELTQEQAAALASGDGGSTAPPPVNPTPPASGPGLDPVSGPPSCRDTVAPSVALGRAAVRTTAHELRIHGTATDVGCNRARGTVARVEVSVARRVGRRCAFLRSRTSGAFARPGSCSKPTFLKATGTATWQLSIHHHLAHGSYVIAVRVTDAAGNRSRPRRLSARLR